MRLVLLLAMFTVPACGVERALPINVLGDPTPAGTRRAIEAWLLHRGTEPGPLFCPVTRSQRILPRGMTPGAVRLMLRRRCKAAGIPLVHPHDCRRSLASDLLEKGEDLSTVQGILGHKSPSTTVAYDLRGEKSRARASERIHVPFREPPTRPSRKRTSTEPRPITP